MTGLVGHRNNNDEKLLEDIRKASSQPASVYVIIDVRPKLNAVANQVCAPAVGQPLLRARCLCACACVCVCVCLCVCV
jgi:hypothetical protein